MQQRGSAAEEAIFSPHARQFQLSIWEPGMLHLDSCHLDGRSYQPHERRLYGEPHRLAKLNIKHPMLVNSADRCAAR
jgi:hypothetical protein